jgi:hypothetical protein
VRVDGASPRTIDATSSLGNITITTRPLRPRTVIGAHL